MAECTPQKLEPIVPTCVDNPNAPLTEWRTGKDEYSPFLERRTCEYSIVVNKAVTSISDPTSSDTEQYESPGAAVDFEDRMKRYAAYGVVKLLEYYNKSFSIEAVDLAYSSFIEREETTTASSWHMPEGRDRKLKVLVTLPFDTLNGYDDLSYDSSDFYDDGETTQATYDVRLIKPQIDFVAQIINDHYGKKHGKWGAEIRDLDLKKESRKLEKFVYPGRLQRLLNENGVNVDLNSVLNTRDESLTFIFSSDYKILDVTHENRYLRIGFNAFTRPGNISSTTAHLVYHGASLFNLFNNHINPDWPDFVETYIYPPRNVEMTFGANFKTNIGFGGAAVIENVTLMDINNALDEGISYAHMVLGYANLADDILNERVSVVPYANMLVKTQAEKLDEDRIILNRVFQSNMALSQPKLFHWTDEGVTFDREGLRTFGETLATPYMSMGQGIAGDVQSLAPNGGGFVQWWTNFNNRIDWRWLMGKIAQCSGMDPEFMDPTIIAILKKLFVILKTLPDIKNVTIPWPDDALPFGRDITEDLINYAIGILLSIIQEVFGEALAQALAALDMMCEENFDYEGIDLQGLLSNSFSSGEASSAFIDTLAGNIGDGTGTSNLFKELMRDISAALNVAELCSLVKGQASQETLTIVYNIIQLDKYAPFHGRFESTDDVAGFFTSFGNLIDPSLCDLPLPLGELCEDGFQETLRRSLLQRKEGVTSEQIESQLALERQRRADLINQLSEVFTSTEDTLSNKLMELLANSGLGEKMAYHPSTQVLLEQVIQSIFYPPLISFATEALGFRETPYYVVEKEETVGEFTIKILEPWQKNKGLINLLTDTNPATTKIARKRYHLYSSHPEDTPDIHTFFDFNKNWGPNLDPDTPDNSWILAHKWWSRPVYFRWNNDRGQYSADATRTAPSWWELEPAESIDQPQINISFFSRDPFVSMTNPYEVPDEGSFPIPPYPILRDYGIPSPSAVSGPLVFNPLASGIPYQPDKHFLEDLNSKDLISPNNASLDVFLDLPKVFEEGLVPSGTGTYTRQQEAYNSIISGRIDDILHPSSVITDILAETYLNTFNMAMKTIHMFAAESELHHTDYYFFGFALDDEPTNYAFDPEANLLGVLDNIKNNFKDPEWLRELTGIENVKTIFGDKIADAMAEAANTSEIVSEALIESVAAYFIRIYILELFLKGLDFLIVRPENRGENILADTFPISNILYNTGLLDYEPPSWHENHQLDLKDILDPVFVSYIFEYIKFSTNEDRLGVACTFWDPFKDMIQEIVEKELEGSTEETLSVYVTNDEGESVGEALAYYPLPSGKKFPSTALKYFIAKQLVSFVQPQTDDSSPRGFQDFVDEPNLFFIERGHVGWGEKTIKRPLMISFLDKLDTLGWHLLYEPPPEEFFESLNEVLLGYWQEYGPGLYLQYYIRDPDGKVLYWGDAEPTYDPAETKIGLRLCIRKSIYDLEEFTSWENLAEQFANEEVFTPDELEKERSYTLEYGFPVFQIERTWDEIIEQNIVTDGSAEGEFNPETVTVSGRRDILEYFKNELIQLDGFRVLFEYAIPVKKLFNYELMLAISAQSLFASNTEDMGVLPPSGIDPENFVQAKAVIRGILENVQNSDNYTYTDSETESAGGAGNLALNNSLEGL